MSYQFLSYSLTTGFYIGVIASAVLIANGFGNSHFGWMLCYMIFSLGIYFGQRRYNQTVRDGNFWHLTWFGTIAGAGAAIIISFFMILYIKFYNHSIVDSTIELSQSYIEGLKIYNADELQNIKGIMQKIYLPVLTFSNIINYAFLSFMFSLVGAWLTQKYNNDFNKKN